MAIRTTVGQVRVRGDQVSEEAGNILVDERHSRDRGCLYVLVETPGRARSDADELGRHLAGVIYQAFFGRRGSVTAGLQQAVREANRLLYDDNRSSLPSERYTAGLSCAVLRGMDLFIAQAGPAAAYVRQGGQVTRYPDVSPWLDGLPPEEIDAAPLGDRAEIDVALFHVQLAPGDAVLLVDSEAGRCVKREAWAPTLAAGQTGGSQAVIEALLRAAPACDLSALALAVEDSTARLAAPAPDADQPAPARAAMRPRPTARPQQAGPSAGERVAAQVAALRIGDRLAALGSRLRLALAAVGAALATLLQRMMPGHDSVVSTQSSAPVESRPAGRRQAAAPASGRPARADSRGRAEPPRPARPSTPPRKQARLRSRAADDPVQKALIGVAIAIPVIVGVVVAVMLVQRGQSHRAEIEALLLQANNSYNEAQATTDRRVAQAALTSAEDALDRLLERQPDHAEALTLRGQVLARYDLLGQVKRIEKLEKLATYPADAKLSRVIVQGLHAFVLDRAADTVYHHVLSTNQQASAAKPEVLVKREQQIDGVLVGELVDMAWMGVDADNVRQRPALVIWESGGHLLEFDPTTGEWTALQVGGADARSNPQRIGSHTGRLYLLDIGANKIWRFAPTREGYAGAAESWLQTAADVVGAVDMAVGDGIYLLFADGRIAKFAGGQPSDYVVTDWDAPPRGPTALASYPPDETESVYVADAGNNRIVQTGGNGKFTQQYRLAPAVAETHGELLQGITSLFVYDAADGIYFVSGTGLYIAHTRN